MAAKKTKESKSNTNIRELLPPKYRELPDELLEEAWNRYQKMRYDYGEAVGVVAAQSISEPATQITLRSYHAAGRVQLVTTKGLPRLIEIFDAKKEPKTPSMTIYLEEGYQDESKVREVAAKIKETTLQDVIKETALDLVNMQVEIVLDEQKIDMLDLTPEKVLSTITKTLTKVESEVEGNVLKIKPSSENVSIKELQQLLVKLKSKHVKGIRGIKQLLIEKQDGEWKITTLGSNLKKVLEIKGVDKKRTYSNNIFEVAEVLGIEAARNLIIREAIETMREQGVDTDVRHIMLVADMMTHTGMIKAIGRYGVAGSKESVLARANFEETVKHLTRAAFAGEADHLTSVVENVIIGNPVPVGTGVVKLKYVPKK